MWDASAGTAWHILAEINGDLAHWSSKSWLALASELEVTQILADTVVSAWEGLANTGLLDWSLDRAGSQLLVPEEHLSASADGPHVLGSALEEDVHGW